jgi:hypothetical protein
MTAPARDHRAIETVVLDLDGVLVLETSTGDRSGEEVLLLHEDLAVRLAGLGAEVVFVTHRSRPEAAAILGAAGLGGRWLDRCLCANDIFKSALTSGQWLRLAREGMRKSLVLPGLRKRFGCRLEHCLFVDDRIDNVLDMCGWGVGLGAVAPSGVDPAGVVTTFDFEEVAEMVRLAPLARDREGAPVLRLQPREIRVASQHRTGLTTHHAARNGFNFVRWSASMVRRGLRRR